MQSGLQGCGSWCCFPSCKRAPCFEINGEEAEGYLMFVQYTYIYTVTVSCTLYSQHRMGSVRVLPLTSGAPSCPLRYHYVRPCMNLPTEIHHPLLGTEDGGCGILLGKKVGHRFVRSKNATDRSASGSKVTASGLADVRKSKRRYSKCQATPSAVPFWLDLCTLGRNKSASRFGGRYVKSLRKFTSGSDSLRR